MYISILGRQPALGMAELERIYGAKDTKWFSNESAVMDVKEFNFERLGGSIKAGRVIMHINGNWRDASDAIVEHYLATWGSAKGKITLGIGAYGFKTANRDVQKTGIVLKQKLKKSGTNLRLIPNDFPALNTATSHHNKLGLAPNKVEILAVRAGNGAIIIAESIGAQNITSFAARDQARPHTDAFIGMLPPKLARIMINLSGAKGGTLLDPFCGTGVVLQEALIDGFTATGTDLSDKMVDYTAKNLAWFINKNQPNGAIGPIYQGDAMNTKWQTPINVVVSETYLGQPFSAPPKPEKLAQVRNNCNHIITSFLNNIHAQLQPGTPLCLAIPAWRDAQGNFTHLPLIKELSALGYTQLTLNNVKSSELLYYRETQVVARELLVIAKT